jgi:hypothetical protein
MVVTDLTMVVDGIRAVVICERDYTDDEFSEAELAFFAQDDDGNVWHLGQHPEEYEAGEIVETPAWFAGLSDAKAGILIKAEPQIGGLSYSQGWGPRSAGPSLWRSLISMRTPWPPSAPRCSQWKSEETR